MKYTIVKGQQKEDVLHINDLQSICPYTAPIPFQGNVGQVQIMRMPCSTQCPLAKVDQSTYVVSCGNTDKVFNLTEKKEGEPLIEGGKIIGL